MRRPFSSYIVLIAVFIGRAQGQTILDRLPLRFEENRGQSPGTSPFIAVGPNYGLEVDSTRNTLTWTDPQSKKSASLRTQFHGANRRARLVPELPMDASTNYFVGASQGRWHTGIRNYQKLCVTELYRGIDLVYYGSGGNLEYDLIVHAGADPATIKFGVAGANRVALTPDGDLLLTTGVGEVRWKKPVLYQESSRGKETVKGEFELARGGEVRFRVGQYDRRRTLVIDPIFSYASYFGGAQGIAIGFENPRGIGVDAAGNVYIAGITASNDLPVTAGALQTAFGGYSANLRYLTGDAFVAKFTAAGALSYVTYLGGRGDDAAFGLAVDSAGNAYVTGMTTSPDFPVTSGALQMKLKGSGGNSCAIFGDAFLAKLNPSGTALIYSTYLGGSMDDFGGAVAIDSQGNAYVAGATLSTDFPTMNAFQSTFGGWGGEPGRPSCNGAALFDGGDAFVAKVNPTGTALLFSTYLGGSADDVATTIALDSSQNVYVGGYTLSRNFPVTKGALQTAFQGSDGQNEFFNSGDGFVAKLSSSGSTLDYATYLGGSGDDAVIGLVVDKAGTAYVTGSTSSQNFPVTATAIQRSYAGYFTLPFDIEQNVGDAFAARLDAKGATLLYSTFLGGSANDGGMGIAVDPSGLIYLTGRTDSTDFRVSKDALQPSFAGDDTSVRQNYFPSGDGFFTIIDPALTTPIYSTYYGGEYNDQLSGIAIDANGNVWMTGSTESPNLKVTSNAAQKTYTGGPASSEGPGPNYPVIGQSMLLGFSTTASASALALKALTNAASGISGVVSPGMVFVAYGTNSAASLITSAVDPASGLLSGTLSGTSVLFDNIPAPLIYVSAGAVAGTVPYEVAGKTSTQVVVEVEGQRTAALTVQVQPTAPGLFSLNETGKGEAVAYNYVNGQASLNSTTNPVPAGAAMVIYATGEGQTSPAGQDGLFMNPAAPKPVAPVSVTIGGVPQTNILYAGAIPGEAPGVLQVNFTLASGTPSGVQPIVVQVGGVSSQPGMTVVVQ